MPGLRLFSRSLSLASLIAVLSIVCHPTDLSARRRDTTPPTVAISTPSAGATVSGTVTVAASASDNVGVASVQFKLDGVNLGARDTIAPYSIAWNTSGMSGSHTLAAVAMDAAGNTRTSAAVTVTVTAGPADTTPPVISAVAASSISSAGATIGWTTDEPSDSQVEYGLTTTYGSTSAANSSLVTTHSVALGLSASTTYHYRVRSRDAAGNLAVSADATLTTMAPSDTTPPTVSITAPAAGATVSAAVTVSAAASDNVGVAGVQFRLDGTDLGAEVTSAPYGGSWNTTTTTDGSHTLTAVARDAAGNRTTSAAVTVKVSNLAPPPPPNGIASQYPGDTGIENHPDVVFVERFNEATTTDLFKRWTDIKNGPSMSFTNDVPAGSPNAHALNIPWVGGGVNTGGHLYKWLSPGIDDTLYVRYYIKLPAGGNYSHHGIWMGGYNPPLAWPNPQAGVKPTGTDRFSAAAEQNSQTSRFDHYDYWMNMHQSSDGNYWGNLLLNNPNVQANIGQWMCVEHMVKLNNPTTSSNGEHAIWLNGAKVSHVGQGFPNGTWSGGIFTQTSSGTPFQGLGWRSDINLNLNYIWLQTYAPDAPAGFTSSMQFAHVVAAKSYIGCLAGNSDTTAPSVSLSSPASGATVSGSVTVSASALDNVGVAGVQFKLDGANLGSEKTSSPYSVAWNTTLSGNGAHTLTAVARDAAGNITTSAVVAVNVSNTASDTTPPSVSLTSPTSGATVSGTVSVSANASDNVAVAGVQFKLDGANVGAEDSSSPYSVSWNTTTAANGVHTLTAVGRDAAGNTTTTTAVTVTVSNTSGLAWPNAPAGLTTINDQPWNQMIGNGWDYLRRSSSKDDTIMSDPTAPFSAPNDLRIVFTPDMAPNTGPSVHWLGLNHVKEIYTGWWMKLSPNWSCSPAGCGKITFLFTDGYGQVYTNVYHNATSDAPPYRIGVNTEWAPYGQQIWYPNVSTTGINPDEWHRVEVYYRWETTPGVSGDGIVRWWVDGTLNGDYRTVHYPASSFIELQYAPTLQNPPPAEQYMYIDHTHVRNP